jgi:hypothetical protein
MNRLLVMLIGLVLSSAAHAQDSLQQWRDSATQAMNEFRSAKKGRIEANGWQFVAGTLSAEEVPISDMFIRGVKTEQGSIRSAYLLNAFYLPVADPELPVYQSTKMLVWFDCKEGNFQQRIVERYPSADGSANPCRGTLKCMTHWESSCRARTRDPSRRRCCRRYVRGGADKCMKPDPA